MPISQILSMLGLIDKTPGYLRKAIAPQTKFSIASLQPLFVGIKEYLLICT